MAARHEDLDQQVAIKILKPEIGREEEAVARFLREARTAARLQSEHIAKVFDVGTHTNGMPYMVMEFLTGRDLQAVVNTRGPLPGIDAVDYILQTLEAVAEAHSLGVVHRDLKPSNLFLASRADGSSHIKVLDFGISKGRGLDGLEDPALTSTRQLIGSPGYMSPEQIRNAKSVDGRTDIWAVGVILFELLAGEPLFIGETVGDTMANIIQQRIPSIRAKRPEIEAGLGRVIDRCLMREVGRRWTDVAALARALAPFGSSWAKLSVERITHTLESKIGSGLGSSLLPQTGPIQPGIHTAATWSGIHLPARSRMKLVASVAAGSTLALVGLGLWRMLSSASYAAVGEGRSAILVPSASHHSPEAIPATALSVADVAVVGSAPVTTAQTPSTAAAIAPTELSPEISTSASGAPSTVPWKPTASPRPSSKAPRQRKTVDVLGERE